MAEDKMIDLATVIGVYSLCNTGAVLIHAIDYVEDRVLASINGEEPEWCEMTDEYWELSGEEEPGFCLGSLFVPFCEVLRISC